MQPSKKSNYTVKETFELTDDYTRLRNKFMEMQNLLNCQNINISENDHSNRLKGICKMLQEEGFGDKYYIPLDQSLYENDSKIDNFLRKNPNKTLDDLVLEAINQYILEEAKVSTEDAKTTIKSPLTHEVVP